MFSMLGNQNPGLGQPSQEFSEPANSDTESFGHVGNGFEATLDQLVFLASLAAANIGNDSFNGNHVVLGASFESDGLKNG